MNSKLIIGIVLLVGGVALLIMGNDSSNSLVDQTNKAFTGRFTDHTVWYMIGGGAAALFGLLALITSFGGKHHPLP